jgi:hypothetical protein
MFTAGQRVFVKYATGAMTIFYPAVIEWHRRHRVRVRDSAGKRLTVDQQHVFATREAAEASVKNLRISLDAATGEIEEFPR